MKRLAILATLLLYPAPQARPAPSAVEGPSSPVEDRLSAIVREFRGVMGVAVVDVRSGETIAVNGDTRFPTASTIKTAVMVEAYHQAAEGRLPLDSRFTLRNGDKVGGTGILNGLGGGLSLTASDLIHLMIVVSDNTATNILIERLGTARINARLESYGLKEMKLFRPTFRDGRADVLPELEREYGLGMTTPSDMAKLLALIASGKAVDRASSEAMMATLRKQQDRAMIPRLLPSMRGMSIGNKTGSDEEKRAGSDGVKRHVRADAAIITGPDFAYALAICARQVEDTRWGIENDALTTGARISRIVFDHFSTTR